jgi:hypothetical protein
MRTVDKEIRIEKFSLSPCRLCSESLVADRKGADTFESNYTHISHSGSLRFGWFSFVSRRPQLLQCAFIHSNSAVSSALLCSRASRTLTKFSTSGISSRSGRSGAGSTYPSSQSSFIMRLGQRRRRNNPPTRPIDAPAPSSTQHLTPTSLAAICSPQACRTPLDRRTAATDRGERYPSRSACLAGQGQCQPQWFSPVRISPLTSIFRPMTRHGQCIQSEETTNTRSPARTTAFAESPTGRA